MILVLQIIALLALIAFVIGAIMWFAASRDTTATVTGPGSVTERARNATMIAVGALLVWAIATIVLALIALF